MLHLVGSVLQQSDGMIKGIIYDAHASHQHIKRVLVGDHIDIEAEELANTPWFGELTYQDLPHNPLPRLPVRIALYKNQVVWGLPGACHSTQLQPFYSEVNSVQLIL